MKGLALSVALTLSLALPMVPRAALAADTAPEALRLVVGESTAGQTLSDRAVGYLCQLRVAYSQRWVPPILFIAHDPETGRVVVSDPITLYFNGGLPVAGKVASETTQRISFTWEYPVGTIARQARPMLYRAGIDKTSGKVIVTAIPAGLDTIFQADGRCEAQPIEGNSAQP